jgi:hypothetical protein
MRLGLLADAVESLRGGPLLAGLEECADKSAFFTAFPTGGGAKDGVEMASGRLPRASAARRGQ